jgi:hypothetical protein
MFFNFWGNGKTGPDDIMTRFQKPRVGMGDPD